MALISGFPARSRKSFSRSATMVSLPFDAEQVVAKVGGGRSLPELNRRWGLEVVKPQVEVSIIDVESIGR